MHEEAGTAGGTARPRDPSATMAELGAETDESILRFFNGDATLADLAVFKRAARAAEFLGATATEGTV